MVPASAMTEAQKNDFLAQVRAIRGYSHAYLATWYGDAVIMDFVPATADDAKLPREPEAKVKEHAMNDLKWSADHIAEKPAEKGRIAKGTVLSMIARFNLLWGNYSEALDAANRVIALNQYELDPDFLNMFSMAGQGSKEIICTYEHVQTTYAFTDVIRLYNNADGGWASAVPTQKLVDMFEMADGTPFDWNNPVHKAHPFFDAQGNPVRDIRMYETLYVNGDQFRGRELRIAKGESEGCDDISPVLFRLTYNGYGMRKFQRDRADEVNGKFYSCPLIRLPEIYLNIAEAMNELGKATTKDEFGNDAYDYINMVRNRVNMPDLTTAKAAPGRELREAILHERAIEFGYEEVRYFDLVRWKRSDLFKTDIERLVITKNGDESFDYVRDNKLVNPRGWIKRWTDRYFLIPIPLDEINKKYGLVQNPGWE